MGEQSRARGRSGGSQPEMAHKATRWVASEEVLHTHQSTRRRCWRDTQKERTSARKGGERAGEGQESALKAGQATGVGAQAGYRDKIEKITKAKI